MISEYARYTVNFGVFLKILTFIRLSKSRWAIEKLEKFFCFLGLGSEDEGTFLTSMRGWVKNAEFSASLTMEVFALIMLPLCFGEGDS